MTLNMYDKVNEYSAYSEDALLEEMKRMAKEGKESGFLNNIQLENFYNQTSLFLNENQLKKLRELIDSIESM